jgi:hypothetical protein
VTAANGAVIYLHFNTGWDDRRSGKAIWTCLMGAEEERKTEGRETEGKEGGERKGEMSVVVVFSGGSVRRGWQSDACLGSFEVRTDTQILSRACTDGLVFATLKRSS